MAVAPAGWLLNALTLSYRHVVRWNAHPVMFVQTRDYAARKGTREKMRKKKVKKVIEKIGFIPHRDRKKVVEQVRVSDVILDDSFKPLAVDNVWIGKFHRWKEYSFDEAIQCHRETHHPTMYNLPNSMVNAYIELNMQGQKKTKFVDAFTKVLYMPHIFDHGEERTVLAFCKSPEEEEIAKEAGADYAGGKDVIKSIQKGDIAVSSYDYYVSTPAMLSDLLLIRGLLKRQFPSTKTGTLSPDIKELVTRFKTGIKYTASPHKVLQYYGTIDVSFGTLDMDTAHLKENLAALINDVQSAKPKREGSFITRVRIICPPSTERLKLDLSEFLPEENIEKDEEEQNEEENVQEAPHIIPSF